MVKYIWISGIILGVISTSVPAAQASLKQLLLSVPTDPVVVSQDHKSFNVKKKFRGIPGVDNVEFQISNTGFDPDDFKYTLQVKPRGFMETRAAGRYDDAIILNTKLKRKLLLNVAIYNRYLLFIDLQEQKTLRELYQELLTLYDDRIKVMENLTYSEDFQMENLIKEENDRTKEKMVSLEIDKNISVLQQRAAVFLGDTSFSGFDTINVVSIKAVIDRIEEPIFPLIPIMCIFNSIAQN